MVNGIKFKSRWDYECINQIDDASYGFYHSSYGMVPQAQNLNDSTTYVDYYNNLINKTLYNLASPNITISEKISKNVGTAEDDLIIKINKNFDKLKDIFPARDGKNSGIGQSQNPTQPQQKSLNMPASSNSTMQRNASNSQKTRLNA